MNKYFKVNNTKLYSRIIGDGFPIIILQSGPDKDASKKLHQKIKNSELYVFKDVGLNIYREKYRT